MATTQGTAGIGTGGREAHILASLPHLPQMYRLREVDPDNAEDVASASRLHLELFGNMGPMAQLGELFMRRFCYTVLLRDGLMRAALCEVDGRPAGLVAYTARSITFHRTAMRNHWGYVAFLVVLSILRQPRLLLSVPRAVRLMFARRGERSLGHDPTAEVVALGVLPEFRSPAFVRRMRLHVGELLLSHAKAYFQRSGLKRMRMIVDAGNRPTLLFYHRLGAHLEPYEQAVVPSVHVWFDFDRASRGPAAPEVPACWCLEPPGTERAYAAARDWESFWAGMEDDQRIFRAEAEDYLGKLEAAVPLSPGARVLDFGCGFGFVADQLAPKVGEVFLWDTSANMRQRARVNVASRENIRFLDLSHPSSLPHAQRFDVILVNSVVQYMSLDEFTAWLGRWREMLAPGGRLVISDLIPPDHHALVDLAAVLGFTARRGLALRAGWHRFGELRRYWKTRAASPLLRVARAALQRQARSMGFEVEFLPGNLTCRAGRMTVLLSAGGVAPSLLACTRTPSTR